MATHFKQKEKSERPIKELLKEYTPTGAPEKIGPIYASLTVPTQDLEAKAVRKLIAYAIEPTGSERLPEIALLEENDIPLEW